MNPAIDLTDQDEFQRCVPHDWFTWLRANAPVHWNPKPNGRGFWALTRHRDVVAVSRDTDTFSSEIGGSALEDLEPDALEARKSMIDMDAPGHTALRRRLTPEFTRRSVANYELRIRHTVREVLDAALPKVEFDFVHDVAATIPIRVLCDILGVPAGDQKLLIDLGDRMFGNTDPYVADVLLDSEASERFRLLPFRSPAAAEMFEYSRWLAAQRLDAPRDDLVSHLVHGRAGTPPLRDRDFDAMFLLLVVAGNETTRSALALGVQAFDEHPSAWERVRESDGHELPLAVEELLRYTTPLHHFRRTATRDVVLHDTQIAEGDKVVVWFTAANRDDAVFDRPHVLDVTRASNPHTSFGRGGPHRCIGEHLARLEIAVTLDELRRRVDRIEIVGEPVRVRSNFTNTLRVLPVAARTS